MKTLLPLVVAALVAGCAIPAVKDVRDSLANIAHDPETVETARIIIALANASGFDPLKVDDPARLAALQVACSLVLPAADTAEGGMCANVATALAPAVSPIPAPRPK